MAATSVTCGRPCRVTTTDSPAAARSIQYPKGSRNSWAPIVCTSALSPCGAFGSGASPEVELRGLEPLASAMPWRRSPN
jgi:hypothetical protein